MKRLTAICLSILMFASSITVYANEEEYTANSWRYENGEPIVSEEEMICAQMILWLGSKKMV